LASVVHVLNRSSKAELNVTPLEALSDRRPNVAGFRVRKSRALALKPKKQHCKLEPRTNVGRFVGYTVGCTAYRILEEETNQVLERRDVRMEGTRLRSRRRQSGQALVPSGRQATTAASMTPTKGQWTWSTLNAGESTTTPQTTPVTLPEKSVLPP